MEPEFMKLRADSQLLLANFLAAEIDLGFTFAEFAVAERGFGNTPHYLHARDDAQTAIGTIRRFLDRIQNPDARYSLDRRCVELERFIATV